MGGFSQGFAQGSGVAERSGIAQDAERNNLIDKQIQTAYDAAPTVEEKNAVLHDALAKDPSKVKQWIANMGARLTGKQPQQAASPYATPTTQTQVSGITDPETGQPITQGQSVTVSGPAPRTKAEAFAGHAARGVLPAQQQADFQRAQVGPDSEAQSRASTMAYQAYQKAAEGKPPEKQRLIAEFFGIKSPSPGAAKVYVSPTGERQAFIPGEQPEGWTLAPTKTYTVKTPEGKVMPATVGSDGKYHAPTGEVLEGAEPFKQQPVPQAKPGTQNGQPQWAVQTPKGWEDPDTHQLIHGFKPQANYASIAPMLKNEELSARTTTMTDDQGLPTVYQYNPATRSYDNAIGTKLGGTAAQQSFQGMAIKQVGDILIKDINNNRAIMGNLDSYLTQYLNGTPISNPAAAGLLAELESFSSMQPAIHAFRSKSAQEAFKKIVGGLANDPDSTIATINALSKTAGVFNSMASQNQLGPKKPKGDQHYKGEKKTFKNGKTGVWDGQGWVAQ